MISILKEYPQMFVTSLISVSLALALPASSPTLKKLPDGPTVIAHRGASGYLPEHTLEAYAMAHAMNAHYIEPDLVLTKDGELVALHDRTLDTTTNVKEIYPTRAREDGRYYAIDFTVTELKKLEVTERFRLETGELYFKNRFPKNFKVGQTIPTLREIIHFVRGLNISSGKVTGIYAELKNPSWHAEQGGRIERTFLEILNSENVKPEDGLFIIQCFEHETLRKLRNEYQTKLPLVQLIGDNLEVYGWMTKPEGLKDIATYADGVGPTYDLIIDKETGGVLDENLFVKTAHELGLKVHPYTLRSDSLPKWASSFDQLVQKLFVEVGVDGAFTDQTDKLIQSLRQLKKL